MPMKCATFKGAHAYGDSQYGKMLAIYSLIERNLEIVLSLCVIPTPVHEAIELIHSINSGLPFWNVDPSNFTSNLNFRQLDRNV